MAGGFLAYSGGVTGILESGRATFCNESMIPLSVTAIDNNCL